MARKKRPKHAARKVTEDQVTAMNRELELRQAEYRYVRGQDKRLVRTPCALWW